MKFYTPAPRSMDNLLVQLDRICSSDFIVNLPPEPMNVIIAFRDQLRLNPYELSADYLRKVGVAMDALYACRLDSERHAIQGNEELNKVMVSLSFCFGTLNSWLKRQKKLE